MGTWGTGLFSDDVACDIRDHYRELLEDDAGDSEATQRTVERFRACLDEADGIALLALALTQSKLGRLDPDIRDRALAVIDRGADLEIWERDNPKQLPKRRAALERARAQLTGPQPQRRRVRRPKRISSGLAAGDVLALALPGRVVLLRVVRVRAHRLGETPVLEELAFTGAEVPPRGELERLGARRDDPIAWVTPLSPDTRFSAFVMQGMDWHGAGFRKVETISARAGDDEAPMPGAGMSWSVIAESYRARFAQ